MHNRTEIVVERMVERILSLALAPAQAEAILGDMRETHSVSLTSSIRIAAAECLGQIVATPLETLGLAAAAFLSPLVALLPVTGLFTFLAWKFGISSPATETLVFAVFFAALQIVTGRLLIRFAAQRTLAVFLLLCSLNLTLGGFGLRNVSINMACWLLPLTAGLLLSHPEPTRRHV